MTEEKNSFEAWLETIDPEDEGIDADTPYADIVIMAERLHASIPTDFVDMADSDYEYEISEIVGRLAHHKHLLDDQRNADADFF